jgi:glutathionylspermidine synthase
MADVALAIATQMLGALPQGDARRVAVVYPTELPEDLGLVRLYQRLFEARGWDVVLGSPYNVTWDAARGVCVFGKPISIMLRHYKTDWWGERESAWADEALDDPAPIEEPLAAVLRGLLDGKLAVVNPFGAVLPQNKRAMAFMWERIHELSQRAQDTVRALVPPTRRLEAMHKEQLAADKDAWVLKSDYGAEGDEVVIGKLVKAETWQRSLALARPGRWIVQRYFEADANAAGEVVNHGVYLVAGEAAGFYARVQKGMTDERALSAPLLVRP